jgi:hypothetical protein
MRIWQFQILYVTIQHTAHWAQCSKILNMQELYNKSGMLFFQFPLSLELITQNCKPRVLNSNPRVPRVTLPSGAEGNVITKSELLIAKAAAEMKVPKKVTESRIRILQH